MIGQDVIIMKKQNENCAKKEDFMWVKRTQCLEEYGYIMILFELTLPSTKKNFMIIWNKDGKLVEFLIGTNIS